ncbi:hypothetical protein DC522_23650 [Microvirga sp. KLBC 81]|uniref:cupin domain-containing protein n=1 Tax=Microvirga sp. KLBC 81 TaxID=1862707 RepID=UPI000D50969B|nr:cupin domain-containing protein [Microvirga sp. KLBC 81]PVE22008.1 hypothetical protein DC522_23650 [Microvirga sp. KLBC 81]
MAIAPDGSEVRILRGLERGGLATFLLPPKAVSRAIAHHTVDEVWYFLSGHGRMWPQRDDYDDVVEVALGFSITMPLGTKYQIRCGRHEPLVVISETIPACSGPHEAHFVESPRTPTVGSKASLDQGL